jgi:DNA-binding transcriptional MocR family regulator
METPRLYLQLAGRYRQAIESGALLPSQRLPSVRKLMQTHDVSLSTALQACRVLEEQGWVEARPRSGYFVRRLARNSIAPVLEPESLAAFDDADFVGMHHRISTYIAKCAAHPAAVNLGGAVAAPEAYPMEALQRAMTRVLKHQPGLLVRPVPVHGDLGFRQVLAQRALEVGVQVAPEELVITYGCTEAVNLALRAVAQPGDTIAVESPTYFGILQTIESLGMRALEIPASPQHGMSVEALTLALNTHAGIKAVVLVPNYQNPLGSVMPDEDKARIAALCAQHAVPVIEDDIYGRLHDAPSLPRALKSWDETGNVIYCASAHKTFAPGMRLGWMMPGRWRARVEMLKWANTRPNDSLLQIAAAEVMGSRVYDRHLQKLRASLLQWRNQMIDAIAETFPPGTRLSPPRGGLVLWVELPPGTSSDRVFDLALREGIRVAPGTLFSNSRRFSHFLRISAGQPLTPEVLRAVRRLAEIVASCAGSENFASRQ